MKNSTIEWTDFTFNPWMGCTKVSPGCANCYAEVSTPARTMGISWGKGQPRKRTSEGNWQSLKALDRKCAKIGKRRKVFCASLADWLDPEVPTFWLRDLLELIDQTPNLDWQLLTKRPELFHDRMADVVRDHGLTGGGAIASQWRDLSIAPPNVWLGVTVENQKMFNSRICDLSSIDAKIKFLSVEPLLEFVNFDFGLFDHLKVDWVIVGGESGPGARPLDIEWVEVIATQCKLAKIPVFVKQLGALTYRHGNPYPKIHKKGGDIIEFPEHLRLREFPN